MQRLQTFINWACVTSEISHVFCCALPTVFSLMGLMAGLGVIAAVPTEFMFIHEAMHDYEMPIIIASGLIILMGWGLHYIAYRIDCRSTGCVHEPCAPKKKRSGKVLMIATVLFLLNVTIYSLVHTPADKAVAVETHLGHDQHGH